MKNLGFILGLSFLALLTSCASLHDRLVSAPLGLSTSEVVQRFGSPDETIDDVNFTHWVYRTETKHPHSRTPRKWLVKYSFQHGTLVEISPEMVPHPDEIRQIEEQAKERLKQSDPNQQNKDDNFKSL